MSIRGINFIDIETTQVSDYSETDYKKLDLFWKKFKSEIDKVVDYSGDFDAQNGEFDLAAKKVWMEKSALTAEFGKIICICIGRLSSDGKFYIKKIYGDSEKELLSKFLSATTQSPGTLCAHNGSEFDFPFLMRKYMMHALPMPAELYVIGKKSWEVQQEDTMKMWGGTAWNYKISLELLCDCLGVPSPKDALSGKRVGEFYREAENKEEALKQIADYCAGDVIAMMNCYCRMKGIEAPSKGSIIVYE